VQAQPPGQAYELRQLLRFRIEEGYLTADFSMPTAMLQAQSTPLRIKGSRARWSVRSGSEMPSGHFGLPSGTVVQINYRDTCGEDEDGFVEATVYSSGGLLSITGRTRLDGDMVSFAYHGRRDYSSAQLEASIARKDHWNEPLVTIYGDSLRELYAEHGLEVDRYLGPALRKLSQTNLLGPGAADVYGAFSSIMPAEQALDQLRQALALLDAVDVDQRQQGSAALARLGSAGVLAAMRLDAPWLSPEQRARLASFVDSHRQRRVVSPEQALGDVRFLVECLEHEDPAVRAEAKRAVEQALQRQLSFDPAAEFEDRFAAVQALRKELGM
jgi:hypothetical protein